MPRTPDELKDILPSQRIHKKKKRPNITESQREKFKKEFLEEWAKEGVTMNAAAEKIGFSRQVIYHWADHDPDFAVPYEKIKFLKKNKSQKEFDEKHKNDEEYKKKFLELYSDDSYSVASALEEIDPKIKNSNFKYWLKTDFEFKKQYKMLQKKLRPSEARKGKLRSAVASAEAQEKQNKFLQLYTDNHFNITSTCKAMGIKRATLKTWCNNDPDFNAALDAAQDEKEDWVEDKLFALVEQGNMPATIFLSKVMLQRRNLGRRHEYIEQPQKIEGRIQHDHTHSFDQDQLDALVRGRQINRGKYNKILELDDPNIIDAECIEDE